MSKYKISWESSNVVPPFAEGTMVNVEYRSGLVAENVAIGSLSANYWKNSEWKAHEIVSFEIVPNTEVVWNGGETPNLPEGTSLKVYYSCGQRAICTFNDYQNNDWSYSGHPSDIVRFSVLAYPETETSEEDVLDVAQEVLDKLIEDSENASYAPRRMTLYHATTPAKAKKYREQGRIHGPVRGFTTLQAAMAWAMKVGRTVIYEIECEDAHKLPDHHNRFGDAWWNDGDVSEFKCVFSAERDA